MVNILAITLLVLVTDVSVENEVTILAQEAGFSGKDK